MSDTKPNAEPSPSIPTSHPVAFWFIFWGEFAERCSFYGMRAILPMYLTTVLHYSDTTAGSIYSSFKMAVYFLPLLGGFLADRYFGKYWAIVGFSVPYVLGHFVLGIQNNIALAIALSLLALGSGVTKPNISTLMGMTYDQKRPGREQLLSAAFQWFYFSINIGALLSIFALPLVRDHFGRQYGLPAGYRIAFQFPTWLMVGALVIFALGKPFYAVETPGSVVTTPEQRKERWKTLQMLFGVFGLIAFFWFAYEHNDSLWVFFTRDYVDRSIPGINQLIALAGSLENVPGLKSYLETVAANGVPPDQLQFLNALFVLIFVPTLTVLFKFVDRDHKIFTATNRILMGFFATAFATGIMTALGFISQHSTSKIAIGWVALAYIVLTLGEVLVYGTGLELSYTAAPKGMKSFITACFLVTNTLGNLINTFFVRLYGGSQTDPIEERGPLLPAQFFGLTTLIVLAAAVAFYFVGKRLSRTMSAARSDPQTT